MFKARTIIEELKNILPKFTAVAKTQSKKQNRSRFSKT